MVRAILVDRFEVTRADRRYYLADVDTTGGLKWSVGTDEFRDQTRDRPAAFLTREEAALLGERRGMRLLTAREWIHVAIGKRPDSHPFPWGKAQKSAANTLDFGLGDPTAVGTFENGKSEPFGCYDLHGNVQEWVSDRVACYEDPGHEEVVPVDPREVGCALGGGFNDRGRATFGPDSSDYLAFHGKALDPGHRARDLGVRHAADAREYLWRFASQWGEGESSRARVNAVGRHWAEVSGRDSVLLVLDDLAVRPGAPPSIGWLVDGARRAR